MHHELKIWPAFYEAVSDGRKTFEVRLNDRGFQAGDTVELKRWDNVRERYTGEQLTYQIGYVLPIDETRVVFSLKELGPIIVPSSSGVDLK